MEETAAAAAAAAVAASQSDATIPLDDDPEVAEVADDVLEGLRRLDQGGNRVTWYVYCDAPVEREGYVEKLRTEQLDEARFANKYGPGEYRVIGRTQDGHYVRGSHKVIKISDIRPEGAPAAGGAPDPVAWMREMREADAKRAQQRAEDLRTYAQILAAPLATLGAALIARRPSIDVPALITALRPQQSTLSEMTTALMNLRQLEGGGTSNIDTVLKLLERLQDLPAGQGDSGWLGVVRDVVRETAPHVRELLGQLQQRPAAPTTAGPAFGPGVQAPAAQPLPPPKSNGAAPSAFPSAPLPASSAPPPGAPPPPATAEEADTMLKFAAPWLRRRADDMHEWASQNMDVQLCAEMLLASVPKTFREFLTPAELLALLQRPDWWQQVTRFHPPLQPYAAWVDDLRQELVALVEDEARGEDAPRKSQSATEGGEHDDDDHG